MFKNYFLTAVRHLLRRKFHAFINIFGMGISIACILIILFFIRNELSYDSFHAHSDSIYRFYLERISPNNSFNLPFTPPPMAEMLKSEFPNIQNVVRIANGRDRWLVMENRAVKAEVTPVDPSLFQTFSFPLETGDPDQALSNINNVILSKEVAKQLAGEENPMGKTITIKDVGEFLITGILAEIPPNSSLNFEVLIHPNYIHNRTLWSAFFVQTYVQLQNPAHKDDLETRSSALLTEKFPPWMLQNTKYRLHLQPLKDIYFNRKAIPGLPHLGNINYIYILSGIGLFIAIIACINFMNLSIAGSSKRGLEIGMRKTFGANKFQIMKQFLSEAFLFTLIALVVGFWLSELFMPTFAELIDKKIVVDYSVNRESIGILFGILVLFTVLSGGYPAVFLAKYHPIRITKQEIGMGSAGVILRKTLVIVQFVLPIMLIIATVVVYSQWNHLRTKNLGFNPQQIVYLPFPGGDQNISLKTIKNELKQYPNILGVAASLGHPGSRFFMGTQAKLLGEEDKKFVKTIFSTVDEDFIETLQIQLKEGRNFSGEFSTDRNRAIIINESLVKKLGIKSPLGKEIEVGFRDFRKGEIIGVVRDFHLKPLLYDMEPVILNLKPIFGYDQLLIKLNTENISVTIQFLQRKWPQLAPGEPFEYHFVNDAFEQSYLLEQRWSKIIFSFAMLAIILSCVGLFALTSLIIVQRTKEIGIRKVFGASISNIFVLLTKEFTILILLANLIAWPCIYLILKKWLQNYPYRISIGWEFFLFTGVIALILALLTIGLQSIKAAMANPVESLRYE